MGNEAGRPEHDLPGVVPMSLQQIEDAQMKRGEIRVTATDVLGQNRSMSRTSTETYVQDSRDRTLTRYVIAALSYSFR